MQDVSPSTKYRIIYADPPWPYYGSTTKDAAAGKHYNLMSMKDIANIPVRSYCMEPAALFLWATCPRLPDAIDTIRAWNFNYRGVIFVWAKTNSGEGLIHGQGVPPTFTKPTTELLLAATTNKTGRPFPINKLNMRQVVLHSRSQKHSEKPDIFRKLIVQLCGDIPRLELFAREKVAGWDGMGNESDGTIW